MKTSKKNQTEIRFLFVWVILILIFGFEMVHHSLAQGNSGTKPPPLKRDPGTIQNPTPRRTRQDQPQPPKFKGPESIAKSSVPSIVIFDNEDAVEIAHLEDRIKLADADSTSVNFVKVILTDDEISLLFPKKSARQTADQDEEEPEFNPSKNFILAKKYEIKAVPYALGCDTYGNCLRIIQLSELNSGSNVIKIVKDISAKQADLETTIPKNYDKISGQAKAELYNRSPSSQTIKKLLDIAKYRGYKNTNDAWANLAAMNDIVADELAVLILGDDAKDDLKIVNKLENFAYKYKGLPAADEASRLAQEIRKKPKGQKY